MEYRLLGKTGISVSAVALGCEGFTNLSQKATTELLSFALENGVNFLDLYSSNPKLRSRIGKALEGRREKLIIQGHLCSIWENDQYLRCHELKKSEAAFEDLLKRLKTDYIDVAMVHYADALENLDNLEKNGVWDFARNLKEKGIARAIGLSSHNPLVGKAAVERGLIDVLMFSINPCYDLQPPDEDVEKLFAPESYAKELKDIDAARNALYETCAAKGIGIDVMKVYGGGDLLSAEYSPFKRALSEAQCLEYALSRPAVAACMVGVKSIDELKKALTWCEATPEEKDFSLALQGLEKFSWHGKCMYCGHCAPCPKGIDVATVLKFLCLAEGKKEIPETVREHYKALKAKAGACLGCQACEKRCPFGVKIVSRLKKAQALFGA